MDLRDRLQQTLGATYTLERELGGGGMSRVFVANEARLARRVVVKVLSPELAAGLSAERFEREIRLAASLQQANIVPVLSAGDTDGVPYYTMPFVDGESLRARLRAGGPQPLAQVVSVLRDVARALAYAHERGIVHRDIKPDNVLLSGGAAVVTDFGIAKAITASRTHHDGDTLTQLGTAIGTPAYIAPEQAAGDPAVDHRADIYSFGCLAYEMLAGQPPFANRSAQRLLAAHLSEPPRPINELRSDTPLPLASMVMRCLEKDAAARPQSAGDLLAALDAATSSGGAALPAVLLGGRRMVWKVLLAYAVAFVVVAVVAKAAIVGIGLPDWVFPGALVVMALGLPVIAFTAYTQYVVRRSVTAPPSDTPGGTGARTTHGTMATIALKASPHVSWRRAIIGGVWAVAAFTVFVGAFMVLRDLGIGPAGSLLAAGRIRNRAPVLITDFAVTNTDSALGAVVSDAVRAALSQSSVISLVSPAAIASTLRLMQREPTSKLDLSLARDVAQRQGVRAIADGSVTGVRGGYIVTLRFVSADSGVELASFRESGDGPRGLIDAADKLARELRARIGESLRSIQATPPLEQVTTSSLEALRKYSAASRATALQGDYRRSVELAGEAVAIDSSFASAWRLMAVAMYNARMPQSGIDSTIERAYRHADRLPEPERSNTIGSYFFGGPHADRTKALAAFAAAMAHGDSAVAPVNAGEALRSERRFAQAAALNEAAIRARPSNGVPYVNLVQLLLDQGQTDAARRALDSMRTHVPGSRDTPALAVWVDYAKGELDSVRAVLDSLAAIGDPRGHPFVMNRRAELALIHGQIAQAERQLEHAGTDDRNPGEALRDSVAMASLDAWFFGDAVRAAQRIDQALARTPLDDVLVADRPYFDIATAYARAARPDKAQSIIARYRAEIADTALLRLQDYQLHDALGEIALAQNKPRDALVEFRKGDVAYDGQPATECAPCSEFNLARAFDAAGMADSAIAAYERFVEEPYFDRISETDPLGLAGAHKRLGELYEAKGDRRRAASHYQQFVTLWKDADPGLQPRVAEVKRRLDRLSEIEKP